MNRTMFGVCITIGLPTLQSWNQKVQVVGRTEVRIDSEYFFRGKTRFEHFVSQVAQDEFRTTVTVNLNPGRPRNEKWVKIDIGTYRRTLAHSRTLFVL